MPKISHELKTTYLNEFENRPNKGQKRPLHDKPVHFTVQHNREFSAISPNLVKIAIFQSYFCPWQLRNGKTS